MELAPSTTPNSERHRCEVLPLTGDIEQDCRALCALLDAADRAGRDCIAILPVQFQVPKLLQSGELSSARQAAFSVVLREREYAPSQRAAA